MLTQKQKCILDATSYVKEKFSDKLSSNTPFTEDEMYHIASTYIDASNLGDKINGFSSNNRVVAGYNTVDKVLYLSLAKGIIEAKNTKSFIDSLNLYDTFPFLKDLTIEELINPSILTCIIHEITHAMQLETIPNSESDKILSDLARYFSGKRKFFKYYYVNHFYKKHYYILPFEREAYVNQSIAYDLNNQNENIRLSILRDLLLEGHVMQGYSNDSIEVCPFETYKRFLREPYDEEKLRKEIECMDMLSKLTFGYQLDDKEFESFSTRPFETTLVLSSTLYRK